MIITVAAASIAEAEARSPSLSFCMMLPAAFQGTAVLSAPCLGLAAAGVMWSDSRQLVGGLQRACCSQPCALAWGLHQMPGPLYDGNFIVICSGPREDATRIGSAGVIRRQAVDISPLRRVNSAIYLISTGAREASFRNIKTIAECLADELINAAKGSSNRSAALADHADSVAELVVEAVHVVHTLVFKSQRAVKGGMVG